MKIKYQTFYLVFLFWMFLLPNCYSQTGVSDTTPIENINASININDKSKSNIWTPYKSWINDGFKIESVNLHSGQGYSSFYSLFVREQNVKKILQNKINQEKYDFKISNCNVNLGIEKLYEEDKKKLFPNSITLRNTYFSNGIDINNFHSNYIIISKCYMPYLGLSNSKGKLEIHDIILNDTFAIRNFTGRIDVHRITTKSDSFELFISNSNIQVSTMNVYRNKKTSLFLWKDTLENFFNIKLYDSLHENSIYFYESFINCPISIFGRYENTKCIFSNCQFGPKASINYFSGKDIVFSQCTNFQNQFDITTDFFINPTKPVYLSFLKTDIAKINFPYLGSIKIRLNDSMIFEEEDIRNYETLLNKYKNEGKVASYEKLMIEYEAYQYSKRMFLGKIGNLLDRLWWNYGFDKSRIFLWTFISIIFFFIGNLFAKNNINKLYPVYGDQRIYNDPIQIKKFNFRRSQTWRILLITIILFFTFKIDVNALFKFKLKFITWVLLQYVFGLWCFFWIINFVFKA